MWIFAELPAFIAIARGQYSIPTPNVPISKSKNVLKKLNIYTCEKAVQMYWKALQNTLKQTDFSFVG